MGTLSLPWDRLMEAGAAGLSTRGLPNLRDQKLVHPVDRELYDLWERYSPNAEVNCVLPHRDLEWKDILIANKWIFAEVTEAPQLLFAKSFHLER